MRRGIEEEAHKSFSFIKMNKRKYIWPCVVLLFFKKQNCWRISVVATCSSSTFSAIPRE